MTDLDEYKGSKSCLINQRTVKETRHRKSLFGKMILQEKVLGEFECPNNHHPYLGGNPAHGVTFYFWRDV